MASKEKYTAGQPARDYEADALLRNEADGSHSWEPVGSLKPWARNPRKNADAVDAVAKSIIAFGWGAVVLVRGEDDRIIAGHTRAKAAQRLKQLWLRARPRERQDWHPDAIRTKDTGEVPVRRKFGLTEAQCDALAIADNKTGEVAAWDTGQLAGVVSDLAENGLVADIGLSDSELDKLLSADVDAVDDVFEVDATELEPHFTMTVTGPLRSQLEALESIRSHLTQRDGVEVFIETQ
jgi:hypothetical protein